MAAPRTNAQRPTVERKAPRSARPLTPAQRKRVDAAIDRAIERHWKVLERLAER